MPSTLSAILIFLTVAYASIAIGVSSHSLKQARADVCPAGFYGKSCSNICPAVCPKSCDRNGSCTDCLQTGVQLPQCVNNCSKGFFGRNCVSRCSNDCSNSTCHPQSGHCHSCNVSGRQLPSCKVRCVRGTYGRHCIQTCPDSCRRTCDPVSGDCLLCLIGEGPQCTVNCALSENEEACKTFCPRRCVSWCNTSTGHCSYCTPGYMSPSCAEHCHQGFHGGGCAQRCSPRCLDSICDPLMGFCNACRDGYVGPTCNGQCIPGFYGFRCGYTCPETCFEGLCHFEDGQCYHCRPGYTGRYCDQLCEDGSFGKNCSESCPLSCDRKCDPVTGKCSQCGLGLIGEFCNHTCPLGFYGHMCANECASVCGDSSCDSVNGECLQDMASSKRNRPATYQGQVIFFATLALIIPIIIICSALDVFRRIEKKKRKKANADMDFELARISSQVKRWHEREMKECERERMNKLQRLKEQCMSKAANNEPMLSGYRRIEDDEVVSPCAKESFRAKLFESSSNKSAESGHKILERPVHPPHDEMRFEDAGCKRPVAALKCQPAIIVDQVGAPKVEPHVIQKQFIHDSDSSDKVPTSSTPQSKRTPFEENVRTHAVSTGEKSRLEEIVDGKLYAPERAPARNWESHELEAIQGVQLKSDTQLMRVARGLLSPPERQIASMELLNPDPAIHKMAGHITKMPFQKMSNDKAESPVSTPTLTPGKFSANEIAISETVSNTIAVETETIDQRKIRKGTFPVEKNSTDLLEKLDDLIPAKGSQTFSKDTLKIDSRRKLRDHDVTGKNVHDTKFEAQSKPSSVPHEQKQTTGMKADRRDSSFRLWSSEFSVQTQRGSPLEELSRDSTSDIKPHVQISKHTNSRSQSRPSVTGSPSWPHSFPDATVDSPDLVSACSTEGKDFNARYLEPQTSELLTSGPSCETTCTSPPKTEDARWELVSSESNAVSSKKHGDSHVEYKKHYSILPFAVKDGYKSPKLIETLSDNERANDQKSVSPTGQNQDRSRTALAPAQVLSSEEESSRCWIPVPKSDYASTVNVTKEMNEIKDVITLQAALSRSRQTHPSTDNNMLAMTHLNAMELSKEAASANSPDSVKRTKISHEESRSAFAGTTVAHSVSSSKTLEATSSMKAYNNIPVSRTTGKSFERAELDIASNDMNTIERRHVLQTFSPPLTKHSFSLGSAAISETKNILLPSSQSQVMATQSSTSPERERSNSIVYQPAVSQLIRTQQNRSGESLKQASMTDQYASFIASMKQYTASQPRIPDWSPTVKPNALLKDGVSSSPSPSPSSSMKSMMRKSISPSTRKYKPRDSSSGAMWLGSSDANGSMVIRCATTRQILPQKSSSTRRANQKPTSPMSLPVPPLNGQQRLSPTPKLSPISKASDISTEDEEEGHRTRGRDREGRHPQDAKHGHEKIKNIQ